MQSGGTPKSAIREFYNGDVPFVSIEDITASGKYLWKTVKHLSERGVKNSAAWIVPKHSLMYSIYATLGVPAINEVDVATNQAILNLIPDPKKVDLEYLYYYLLFFRRDVYKYSAQTTQSNLNAKIVKEFQIQLPSTMQEQFAIASVLATIDQAIENTQQLIAKYELIKTGLMQDLLTRGIDEQGDIRSSHSEYKKSNLGRIPNQWEVFTLSQVCERIQDGTHFSPNTTEDGQYLYITSKNIRMGCLKLNDVERISQEAHDAIYRHCPVERGDVLLTKDGANTGNVCINTIGEPISLLSSVAFLRGKQEVLMNEFLYHYLASEKAQKMMTDQMSGNAITRITLTKINGFQIALPDLEEQKRIVSVLNQRDQMMMKEKDSLEKLQLLKTALMQDLLTGKVRVDALMKKEAAVV